MLIKLLFIVLALFIGWQLVVYLRMHPESLTWKNLNKSFFTLGILALLLIGFIAILVWFIKR